MKFNQIQITGFEKAELSPQTLQKLKKVGKRVIFCSEDDPTIDKIRRQTDCLLVKFNLVDKNIIDSSPLLKYIGVMSTGFARVNIKYAKKKGVTVTNAPGYSTNSVAEFVFAAILDHIRQLEKGKTQARGGNYSESGFTASEIKNKTFGILGLGKIGIRVAQLASCFGANVLYWSRNRKKGTEKESIKYAEVQKVISESDFLSLHFALNPKTKNFLNKNMVAKIKKGAVVVNTAPMELIDINSLEKRLKAKDLIFILDHSDEMNAKDLKRLSKYKNCIIYPPIAYISKEARETKQEILVGNIQNFLKNSPTNVVN